MKNALYFLLGLSLIVLTSATTASIMTVTPAKPKSVIVFSSYSTADVRDQIRASSNLGYIVKSCNANSAGGLWLVVMEKY